MRPGCAGPVRGGSTPLNSSDTQRGGFHFGNAGYGGHHKVSKKEGSHKQVLQTGQRDRRSLRGGLRKRGNQSGQRTYKVYETLHPQTSPGFRVDSPLGKPSPCGGFPPTDIAHAHLDIFHGAFILVLRVPGSARITCGDCPDAIRFAARMSCDCRPYAGGLGNQNAERKRRT